MTIKRNISTAMLLPLLFISGAVAAAPASYAEIIEAERQHMKQSHPSQGNAAINQQRNRETSPITPITWGTIIQAEHRRMAELHPSDTKQDVRSEKTGDADLYRSPTTWNELIHTEKDRMNQTH